MNITLRERTAETVAIYFEKAQHPAICKTLPQRARTVDEALAEFEKTQQPGTTSYGRTVRADGTYVGGRIAVYYFDNEGNEHNGYMLD